MIEFIKESFMKNNINPYIIALSWSTFSYIICYINCLFFKNTIKNSLKDEKIIYYKKPSVFSFIIPFIITLVLFDSILPIAFITITEPISTSFFWWGILILYILSLIIILHISLGVVVITNKKFIIRLVGNNYLFETRTVNFSEINNIVKNPFYGNVMLILKDYSTCNVPILFKTIRHIDELKIYNPNKGEGEG